MNPPQRQSTVRRVQPQLTAASHPRAVSKLGGYVLEDGLGQGGMGVVYRARELQTGRVVALKTLTRIDPNGIYRLKREFRALADVVHPNLVRLFELGCDGEQWYFTMELVGGSTLLDSVGVTSAGVSGDVPLDDATPTLERAPETPGSMRGSWDEVRLRDAFTQLTSGVAAIHDSGKLHCDLKPSNVLLEPSGRVVVLDFGIVKSSDPDDPLSTLDGDIAGTPEYMSPEQTLGLTLTAASDWYAFGVMLYEALAGELPFRGSPLAVMAAKQSALPAPPSSLKLGVPAELEALCMQLLAIDPAQRPEREEISRRLAPPSGIPTLPPALEVASVHAPLMGREPELQALRAAARDVAHGKSRLMLVSGPSGIGKSSLLRSFARELALQSDMLVLRGQCYERESLPYKAFDSIVDELSRYLRRLGDREVAELLPRDIRALARMFPVLKRIRAVAATRGRRMDDAHPASLRQLAERAFKELLVNLADRQRVVLIIDDMQWGDTESAHLLTELLQPPEPPALLVIGGARSEHSEHSPMLNELRALPESLGTRQDTLSLEALSPEHSQQLAAALLGAAPRELVDGIAREAGGHPLFVQELARYAEQARSQAHFSSALQAGELSLPRVLTHRVQALGRVALRVLELVAVASRPVSQLLLTRIEPGADTEVWQELCNQHMLRAVGASSALQMECYHDRIRDVVLSGLSEARLQFCHRALAAAMEEAGAAEPEALVEHFRAAGELERAREHVRTSAEAASHALAFDRAARLYQLALDIGGSGLWQAAELRRRLADSLAAAGRNAQAAEAYCLAAQHCKGLAALSLQRLAAQHFLSSGHEQRGLALLRQVLAAVDLDYPETEAATLLRLGWARAKLRVWGLRYRERDPAAISPLELARIDTCFSAAVGLTLSDLARSAAFSAQHLCLALKAGDPERIARGLTFELGTAPAAGEEGLRWAERAMPLAERLRERHDDAYHAGLLSLARAHVAYMQGRFGISLEWARRAESTLRDAHGSDVQWALLSSNVLFTCSSIVTGELEQVGQKLPSVLREAEERGDLHGISLMAYPRVLLALARDDVDAARAALAQSMPALQLSGGFRLRDYQALHCELLIDRYRGDARAAFLRLEQRWPALERSKLLLVNILRVTALVERASTALDYAALGGGREALAIARQTLRALERESLPHARAFVLMLKARMHGRQPQRMIALLTESSQRLDACGLTLHAESARRCLGVITGDELGAVLVAQADQKLARLGVRNPARFAAFMAPGFAPLPRATGAPP